MVIKLIGCGAVALASVIMAISYRRFFWRKLDTIDGFIALLFYIKGQIDCYSRPRSDILSTLPPEIFHACNCPQGATTLEELVDASRIYLDDEPTRLLGAFCAEFGSTVREEQLRRCDHYIAALSEQRRMIASAVESKSRAGSALWICAGLAAVILFW